MSNQFNNITSQPCVSKRSFDRKPRMNKNVNNVNNVNIDIKHQYGTPVPVTTNKEEHQNSLLTKNPMYLFKCGTITKYGYEENGIKYILATNKTISNYEITNMSQYVIPKFCYSSFLDTYTLSIKQSKNKQTCNGKCCSYVHNICVFDKECNDENCVKMHTTNVPDKFIFTKLVNEYTKMYSELVTEEFLVISYLAKYILETPNINLNKEINLDFNKNLNPIVKPETDIENFKNNLLSISEFLLGTTNSKYNTDYFLNTCETVFFTVNNNPFRKYSSCRTYGNGHTSKELIKTLYKEKKYYETINELENPEEILYGNKYFNETFKSKLESAKSKHGNELTVEDILNLDNGKARNCLTFKFKYILNDYEVSPTFKMNKTMSIVNDWDKIPFEIKNTFNKNRKNFEIYSTERVDEVNIKAFRMYIIFKENDNHVLYQPEGNIYNSFIYYAQNNNGTNTNFKKLCQIQEAYNKICNMINYSDLNKLKLLLKNLHMLKTTVYDKINIDSIGIKKIQNNNKHVNNKIVNHEINNNNIEPVNNNEINNNVNNEINNNDNIDNDIVNNDKVVDNNEINNNNIEPVNNKINNNDNNEINNNNNNEINDNEINNNDIVNDIETINNNDNEIVNNNDNNEINDDEINGLDNIDNDEINGFINLYPRSYFETNKPKTSNGTIIKLIPDDFKTLDLDDSDKGLEYWNNMHHLIKEWIIYLRPDIYNKDKRIHIKDINCFLIFTDNKGHRGYEEYLYFHVLHKLDKSANLLLKEAQKNKTLSISNLINNMISYIDNEGININNMCKILEDIDSSLLMINDNNDIKQLYKKILQNVEIKSYTYNKDTHNYTPLIAYESLESMNKLISIFKNYNQYINSTKTKLKSILHKHMNNIRETTAELVKTVETFKKNNVFSRNSEHNINFYNFSIKFLNMFKEYRNKSCSVNNLKDINDIIASFELSRNGITSFYDKIVNKIYSVKNEILQKISKGYRVINNLYISKYESGKDLSDDIFKNKYDIDNYISDRTKLNSYLQCSTCSIFNSTSRCECRFPFSQNLMIMMLSKDSSNLYQPVEINDNITTFEELPQKYGKLYIINDNIHEPKSNILCINNLSIFEKASIIKRKRYLLKKSLDDYGIIINNISSFFKVSHLIPDDVLQHNINCQTLKDNLDLCCNYSYSSYQNDIEEYKCGRLKVVNFYTYNNFTNINNKISYDVLKEHSDKYIHDTNYIDIRYFNNNDNNETKTSSSDSNILYQLAIINNKITELNDDFMLYSCDNIINDIIKKAINNSKKLKINYDNLYKSTIEIINKTFNEKRIHKIAELNKYRDNHIYNKYISKFHLKLIENVINVLLNKINQDDFSDKEQILKECRNIVMDAYELLSNKQADKWVSSMYHYKTLCNIFDNTDMSKKDILNTITNFYNNLTKIRINDCIMNNVATSINNSHMLFENTKIEVIKNLSDHFVFRDNILEILCNTINLLLSEEFYLNFDNNNIIMCGTSYLEKIDKIKLITKSYYVDILKYIFKNDLIEINTESNEDLITIKNHILFC